MVSYNVYSIWSPSQGPGWRQTTLIILKDNSSRIEEFKVITSYEIKNKNVVMRGAVEVIELPGPVIEGSGLFGDENGEELDFQDSSRDSSREDGDIEDLFGLAD